VDYLVMAQDIKRVFCKENFVERSISLLTFLSQLEAHLSGKKPTVRTTRMEEWACKRAV